jgi:hypothetical protein
VADCLKHIYEYIQRNLDGHYNFLVKVFRQEVQVTTIKHDWTQDFYSDIVEELAYDMPEPLGTMNYLLASCNLADALNNTSLSLI